MRAEYINSGQKQKEDSVGIPTTGGHPTMSGEQIQARLQELERERVARESSKIAHPQPTNNSTKQRHASVVKEEIKVFQPSVNMSKSKLSEWLDKKSVDDIKQSLPKFVVEHVE